MRCRFGSRDVAFHVERVYAIKTSLELLDHVLCVLDGNLEDLMALNDLLEVRAGVLDEVILHAHEELLDIVDILRFVLELSDTVMEVLTLELLKALVHEHWVLVVGLIC